MAVDSSLSPFGRATRAQWEGQPTEFSMEESSGWQAARNRRVSPLPETRQAGGLPSCRLCSAFGLSSILLLPCASCPCLLSVTPDDMRHHV